MEAHSKMDAYSLDLTTGVLSKNGAVVPNVIDVECCLRYDSNPGPIEGARNTQVIGFRLFGKVRDLAADARVLAQGPPGLIPSIDSAALTHSRYRFESRRGDTIALVNVPATIASASLVGREQP